MSTEGLKEILAYIDQHISEKISLVELAEMAGYTPFYFSKLFSEIMGMPITGYIRIRKLQYALGSLLKGKKVLDVSLMYAFDSHEVFRTSFEEVNAGYCTEISITLFEDGKVKIADNGRGIPLSQNAKTNQQVLDKILSGHPISSLEYTQMGDFSQCGMQVVNSLCESLQINVYRDGKCYSQDYVRGIAQHDVSCSEMVHASGTEIILKPDSLIFGDAKFSVDMIKEWVAENNMKEVIVRVKKQSC